MRPFNGIFAISFVERVFPSVASLVSRMGCVSLFTTTVVPLSPTVNVALTFAVWLISTANAGTVPVLNPAASMAKAYVPMGRNRIVYAPEAFVCAVVFTPVAVFSAVTLAPTTTAPLGSVTTPVMDPVTVCPKAVGKLSTAIMQLTNRLRTRLILILSSCSLTSSGPQNS